MEWFSLIKLADDPDYGDLYTVFIQIIIIDFKKRAKSSYFQ